MILFKSLFENLFQNVSNFFSDPRFHFLLKFLSGFGFTSLSQVLMLGLMLLMVVCLVFDFFAPDIMALIVLVVLGAFGLLKPNLLFSGFSSTAVIALIAVMIIGRSLERAGWVSTIAAWAFNYGKGKSHRTLWILMLISGLGAGLLRSAGVTALLLPVVGRLSMLTKIPKAKLLIPVGFCAIIGGSLTMVGSGPLLVLNDLLAASPDGPIPGIRMFSLFWIGLILLIFAMIFLRYFSNGLLPKGDQERFSLGMDSLAFKKIYGFGGNFLEARVLSGSELIGKNISDLEKQLDQFKIAIVAMTSGSEVVMPPLRRMEIRLSTRLAFLGEFSDVEAFCSSHGLRLRMELLAFSETLNPMNSGFSEIVIPPGSPLIGVHMNELHMRRRYQVQVLSIFRDNRYYKGEEMQQLNIKSGDTLGVFSDWESLSKLEKEHNFAVVTSDFPKETQCHTKKIPAFLIFLFSMGLVIFSPMPAAVSLLIGALLMVLMRVIKMDEAYKAISWQTVFLLAGLIPFGLAMQETGTAQLLASWLLSALSGCDSWVVLSALALLASAFGLAMSNVGATVVLVPVSVHIAHRLGADPRLFAILTALATSNAFILPTHQVSTLIFGPGHYRVKDFLKIGAYLSLLYLVVLMVFRFLV
jgi:di/tricarboxylate transporter